METYSDLLIFLLLFSFKSYYVVWKLTSPRVFLCHSARLNRTMQYGNPRPDMHIRSGIVCLNRTMQYGNFFHSHVIFFILLFKSYYVVWKLFSSQIVCSRFSQFKSYYVVWKLCFFSSSVIMFFRLNRTMQYGNICEKIQTVKCRRV